MEVCELDDVFSGPLAITAVDSIGIAEPMPRNLVITDPNGNELLRAERNGEVWVRGEKVADNKDFYIKFCELIGVNPSA